MLGREENAQVGQMIKEAIGDIVIPVPKQEKAKDYSGEIADLKKDIKSLEGKLSEFVADAKKVKVVEPTRKPFSKNK